MVLEHYRCLHKPEHQYLLHRSHYTNNATTGFTRTTAGDDPARNFTQEQAPVDLRLLHNFPDPSLLNHNGTWYAYATNNAAQIEDQQKTVHESSLRNAQLATSKDFESWKLFGDDMLPSAGPWAKQDPHIWAPAILRLNDTSFVLYYSAVASRNNARNHHCIGAAISSLPTGPFAPLPTVLICPLERGGAIDAAPFKHPETGALYLAYKIDGNALGNGGNCGNTISPIHDTPILLQELDAQDGITLIGEPSQILERSTLANDGPLVEAPSIVYAEGRYWLFFSSGCWRNDSYDVKVALADRVDGNYKRVEGAPLLTTGAMGLVAPGSVDVVRVDGEWMVAFHARTWEAEWGSIRAFYTVGIKFHRDNVKVQG